MKKRIVIINGPNLNLLGSREPQIYGHETFEGFLDTLKEQHAGTDLEYYQSNVEGELINLLHENRKDCDGIILNPGGYSHTSVALADAIAAIDTPVVEVHISNIHAREDYRQTLLTGSKCKGIISGLGLDGYRLALHYLHYY